MVKGRLVGVGGTHRCVEEGVEEGNDSEGAHGLVEGVDTSVRETIGMRRSRVGRRALRFAGRGYD